MKEKIIHSDYNVNVKGRRRTGSIWRWILQLSTIIGIIALITLLLNIINGAFGYVALEAKVDPATLAVNGVPLEEQSKEQLIDVLRSNLSSGAFNKLEHDQPFAERSRANVYQLVIERIVKYDIKASWQLWDSLTRTREIKATVAQDYPNAQLRFISWFTTDFVSRPQTSEALTAGVRTAILGSLWTILFTVLLAFPLGVGAAIYLEEYATDNWLNRLIRT